MTTVKFSLRLWCFVAVALIAQGQYSPASPCPEIFTFESDGQQWYGIIKIPNSSFGSKVKLSVKILLASYLRTKHSGSIEPIEHKNSLLNYINEWFYYKVNFPNPREIPKVIHIILNGKQICRGISKETNANEAINVVDISLDNVIQKVDEDINNIDSVIKSTHKKITEPLVQSRSQLLELQQVPHYSSYEHGNINNREGKNKQQAHNNATGDILEIVNQLMNDLQTNDSFRKTQDTKLQENNYLMKSEFQSIPSLEIVNDTSDIKNVLRKKRASYDELANAENLNSNRSPFSDSYECGVSSEIPLFVHGNKTIRGNWPWVVALLKISNSEPQFYCGGTLISDQHVITAAHCTRTVNNSPLSENDLLALVGAFNLINWRNDNDVQPAGVAKIEQHPSYVGSRNKLNDIAILILDRTISFSNYIQPVCLWTFDTDEKYLTSGTVVGWGRDENNQKFTPEPRAGKIPIVSLLTCRGTRKEYYSITSDKTICAGGRNGVGPCNGDSGSGMYIAHDNKWYLRGIVSVSLPNVQLTCNLEEYVVFTDAAKYGLWIETTLRSVTQPETKPATVDLSEECGISSGYPLSVKSSKTHKGDWPWLAAVYIKRRSKLDFACTSILVSHRHVIIAPQCLIGIKINVIFVKIGAFNQQDWTDPDAITLGVSILITHPNFTYKLYDLYDIGILFLAKSVQFSNYIRPVCLWNTNTDLSKIVGRSGTTVVWDRNDEGIFAEEPTKWNVPIVSTETCRNSNTRFSRLTSESSICAGARDGIGPCAHGGMFLSLGNRWYLRGLTSIYLPTNDRSCNYNEYAVYTDTAKYLPWIQKVIQADQ